jgi:hypothetical protein
VGRILKAYINAQWISDFDQLLSAYARLADTGTAPEDPGSEESA